MSDFPTEFVFQMSEKSLLSAIVKIPKDKPKSSGYQDLVCTTEDQATIYEIITTLAENGKLSLLLKQSHLKTLGSQINHVHPLKFLSTIVNHPQLRECLINVFDDYFKRNGFMDGLGPSLTRESEKGKLDPLIEDFAQEVQVAKEKVEPFFQERDWEGLVRFFIQGQ